MTYLSPLQRPAPSGQNARAAVTARTRGVALLALFAALLAAPAALGEVPKWVRLSWATPDAGTTIAITWNTDAPDQPTEVQYGPTPQLGSTALGTAFKANGEIGFVHEVELFDLEPGTLYYYRAGGSGQWSDVYELRTAALPGCTPIRFVALGDGRSQDENGPALNWPDIYAESLLEEPDFVINTGDIVKDGHETKQWRKWLQETAPLLPLVPHMTSLGNHDDDKDDGDLASYNQIFQLPRNKTTESEDFYFFTWGDAILVSLSTATYADGTNPYEVQAQWLDEVLTENPRTWKFVFFHHPIYTSHAEAFGIEFNHPPNELGQNAAFVPVFDKHHIDVVFMGHNHFYERFAPMAGGGGSATGNPVGDPSKGTIYVITGGAGAFTYDKIDLGFTEIDPMEDIVCAGTSQAPGSQKCSGKHHFVSVTVDGDTMQADVIATSAQNFTNDSNNIEIIDTFSITKDAPLAPLCEEDPEPDPPDTDAGSTGGEDAGSTDDGGSADAAAVDAGGGPDAIDTGTGEKDTDSEGSNGDSDIPPGGGGVTTDTGSFGQPGMPDAGATGGGGGSPGLTPTDENPGISPVPTPNQSGSASGSASGGCSATGGNPALPWLSLLLVLLVAVRLRWARRLVTGAVVAVLIVPTQGCGKSEPPAPTATPTTETSNRRAPEPEGIEASTASAPNNKAEATTGAALPGDPIELESLGGVRLTATWLAPASATAPVVLLVHQLRSDRTEWAPLAAALARVGDVGLLALDLRGHGGSTTRGSEQVDWEHLRPSDWPAMVADVRAAITWIRGRSPEQPTALVLVGSSIGGSACLLYAAEDDRIAGVALLSPGLDYHGLEILPALAKQPARPLFIAASRGDGYSAHSARVLVETHAGAEVAWAEGTEAHGVTLLAEQPAVEKALLAWLTARLGLES